MDFNIQLCTLTLNNERNIATTTITKILPIFDIKTSELDDNKKKRPTINATNTERASMAISAIKSNQRTVFNAEPATYFISEKKNRIANGIIIESHIPSVSDTSAMAFNEHEIVSDG